MRRSGVQKKYVSFVQDMHESNMAEKHCRSDRWLQGGYMTASRIGPKPSLVCLLMDRLIDGGGYADRGYRRRRLRGQ